MDRFASKSIETQTIYEIYRACRLCGAGGGYKMPIIQNVVNIDGCDVELKQKIRECVQIEVNQDDRMPPLICELCVDKVNDFYEFLEMCRQTNKRTRLRLGLPPQTMPRGAPDAGDCILGVTEPIYVNDEDSNEPLSKKPNVASTRNTRFKKEPQKEKKEVKVKIGSIQMGRQCRSVRVRAPTPPRSTRDKRDKERDNMSLSKLQQTRPKRLPSPPPKSILKKANDKKAESPLLSPRLKRSREKDTKAELPAKRVKIAAKPLPPRSSKPSPQLVPKKSESKDSAPSLLCKICKQKFKSPQALVSHQRSHTVTFTNPKLACNACELWFSSAEEAGAHHKRHRSRPLTYRCRRCGAGYKLLQAYQDHTCLPWDEVPDVECPKCWRSYATQNLLDYHRCPGISGRRGGKCSKCNKTFSNRKVLTKHENSCKKGDFTVDPEMLGCLKPLQIRVAKCDPLLTNIKQEHYDVSSVGDDFGLDKTCVYPYSASGLRIKSELSDCMVKINDLDFASYVHWDSDDSGESDSENLDFSFTKQHKVESLAAWALKTIFSKKLLGKVPRKFRRLKIENIIGNALNDSLSDVNMNDNKDKTVDSELSANDSVAISDKDKNVSVDDRDDDDLFPKESKDKVTNDDFDSLFNSSVVSDNNLSVTDKIDGKVSDSVSGSDDLISVKDSVVKESNNDSDSNIVNDNGDSKNATNEESIVETNSTESKESSQKTDLDVETNGTESSLSKDENNVKDDEKIDGSNGIEEEGLKSAEENTPDAESGVKEAHTEMEVDSNKNNSTETQDVVQKSNDSESAESNVVESEVNGEELGKQEEINEESQENAEIATEDSKINTNDSEPLPKDESSNEPCTELSTDGAKADTEKTSTNNEDSKDKEISSNEHKAKELTENDENLVNGTNFADDNLNMDDLEDWSDSEMDDGKLMADLDEQIGEKETQDSKASESETTNKIQTEGSKMEVDEDKIVCENLLPKEDVANISDKELKVAE